MKTSAINYLIATTFVLITVVIFAAMGLSFNLIFYLTVFGQILLVFSVIKILKDNYSTQKTFENFYEDFPR